MKSVFISAGEVSGDLHGSYVVQALREQAPNLHIYGIGGELLQNAGMECTYPISALSVMGVADVVKKLFSIASLLRSIKKEMHANPPDAIVLIDAPSFNFRIAKMAYALGIPVYYYISPKVWASRPKRVYFMKKYCKKIFCIFPFEVDFYKRYGMEVEYVGNPLVQYIEPIRSCNLVRKEEYITILPGSRTSEITTLLPIFVQVASKLYNDNTAMQFFCVRAPSIPKALLEQYIPSSLPITIIEPEERYSIIAQSALALVASGTATLETALLGTPTIVSYKIGAISAFLMKLFMTVSYVSLPNIILNKEVFPELLQEHATVDAIYTSAHDLLYTPEKRVVVEKDLQSLRTLLGEGYASAQIVANAILCDKKL